MEDYSTELANMHLRSHESEAWGSLDMSNQFTLTYTPLGAGIGARYFRHAVHGAQSDSKRTQAEYPIYELITTCDRTSKPLVEPSPLSLKENLVVKLHSLFPEGLTSFANQ